MAPLGRILAVSLAANLLGVSLTASVLAAPPRAERASHKLTILSLSSRPEMVSGGDGLVRVAVPRNVPLDQVTVELNDSDVTDAFRPDEAGRSLTGLVTGLRLGDNELVARGKGRRSAELTLRNHPITGPVFSGPHERPFICQTQDFVLPTGKKLGPPLDPNCSVATRVDYLYKSGVDGTFKALPDPSAYRPTWKKPRRWKATRSRTSCGSKPEPSIVPSTRRPPCTTPWRSPHRTRGRPTPAGTGG